MSNCLLVLFLLIYLHVYLSICLLNFILSCPILYLINEIKILIEVFACHVLFDLEGGLLDKFDSEGGGVGVEAERDIFFTWMKFSCFSAYLLHS